MRVRGVVRAGLNLAALLITELTGAGDRHHVIGVEQVVAPTAVERVLAGAADQPVVALVAEDRVAAVAVAESGGEAGPVRGVVDAAVHCRALVGVQIEEPHEPCPELVDRAVGIEQHRAARVVLVVESKLTEAGHDRPVVVPGVVVEAEVEQVAWVERAGPVGAVGVG